jgi:hypothetical protein
METRGRGGRRRGRGFGRGFGRGRGRGYSANRLSTSSYSVTGATNTDSPDVSPTSKRSRLSTSADHEIAAHTANVEARIDGPGTLVVKFLNDASLQLQRRIFASRPSASNRSETNQVSTAQSQQDTSGSDGSDDQLEAGRRRYQTYSKQWTLRHPEIDWVHRGQGRYISAAQARALNDHSAKRQVLPQFYSRLALITNSWQDAQD